MKAAVWCPRFSCTVLMSSPALNAATAYECPNGIIRTNRKSLYLQRVGGLSLFFFHEKRPQNGAYRREVKKQGCSLMTNFRMPKQGCKREVTAWQIYKRCWRKRRKQYLTQGDFFKFHKISPYRLFLPSFTLLCKLISYPALSRLSVKFPVF